MTDLEKIEQIQNECKDIEALLKKAGDNGYLFAASLFRLARTQHKDSACKIAADSYIEIMRSIEND
jgi:hypothetical protein